MADEPTVGRIAFGPGVKTDEDVARLRARVREVEATLAAQVEVTDRETTRLRGLLNESYQTNHAERIELAGLRERVTALEAGLGRARDRLTTMRYSRATCPFCGQSPRSHLCALIPIMDDIRALLARPIPEPTPKGDHDAAV